MHSIFYPNDVDAGTKTFRQLQAEEDEEERFQADLKRAVRQSLGRFSTILVYISCLPDYVICMKNGLLYIPLLSISGHILLSDLVGIYLFRCLKLFSSPFFKKDSAYLFCDNLSDKTPRYEASDTRTFCLNPDVYQGGRNMTSYLRTPLEVNNNGVLSDVTMESHSSTGVAIFGTGLQNEVGEYNCFLNVIIQVTFNPLFITNCLISWVSMSIVSCLKVFCLLILFFWA